MHKNVILQQQNMLASNFCSRIKIDVNVFYLLPTHSSGLSSSFEDVKCLARYQDGRKCVKYELATKIIFAWNFKLFSFSWQLNSDEKEFRFSFSSPRRFLWNLRIELWSECLNQKLYPWININIFEGKTSSVLSNRSTL